MTLNDQVELMESILTDGIALNVLKAAFAQYASDSPISGTRETQIVEEFNALVTGVNALYLEVLKACATWINAQ